jgi:hypothetical protein
VSVFLSEPNKSFSSIALIISSAFVVKGTYLKIKPLFANSVSLFRTWLSKVFSWPTPDSLTIQKFQHNLSE